MKNLICFIKVNFISLVLIVNVFSQTTNGFNYQAIARDTSGDVLKSQNIGIRISIIQDSINGVIAYSENHNITTDGYGVFDLVISEGTVESGTFASISWGGTKHYVKIELDEEGGTNYTDMGTTQLLAVPYALYADTAGNVNNSDTSATNELQALTISNDTIYLENGGEVKLPAQTGDFSNGGEAGEAIRTLGNTDNYGLGFLTNGDTNLYVDANGNIGIGTTIPSEKLEINGNLFMSGGDIKTDRWLNCDSNTFIGMGSAGGGLLSHGSGDEGWYNTALGYNTLNAIGIGYSNTAIGYNALLNNTQGFSNTAIGVNALLSSTTQYENTAIGRNALFSSTGHHNTATGATAIYNNIGGSYNTANGYGALSNGTSGSRNTAIGSIALYDASGDYNTALGYQAGDNITTGSNNIIIGAGVDAPVATADSQLNIGNTIYGDLSEGYIGIGTTDPSEELEVNGTLKADTLKGDGSYITGLPGSFLGEVKMFAISLTGAITKTNLQAAGWAICDGTTPSAQGISGATITTTPNLQHRFIRMSDDEISGTIGGQDSVALTVDELPSHRHRTNKSTSVSSSYGFYTVNNYAGEHDNDDGGWTDYVGGDSPHENRPPFYELVFFIKVK
ncbi:MAG: hypothetical protein JXB49_31415 [Bacteroidales bacterium]|nr:hypothetical protein [Bacteroidales bacterium]